MASISTRGSRTLSLLLPHPEAVRPFWTDHGNSHRVSEACDIKGPERNTENLSFPPLLQYPQDRVTEGGRNGHRGLGTGGPNPSDFSLAEELARCRG
jgi:hypothetical protein